MEGARDRFRSRRLMGRTIAGVLLMQFVAFAAAAAAFHLVAGVEMSRDFFSAHGSVQSARRALLPALAVAGVLGFLLVAAATLLGVRACAGRFVDPIRRADDILRRLAQGKLSLPGGAPGGKRSALDDSADEVAAVFAEKTAEIQRTAREIHNAVLALRYKATGSEQLTLKELRESTGTMDGLCKQLSSSVKWFEVS